MASARVRSAGFGMGKKRQTELHSATAVAAFIGIGSNLGDRLAACRGAIALLEEMPAVRLKKISSLYQTAPVDYLEQPSFYNAVVEIETSLPAPSLLEGCQQIERQLGKRILIPKGPRTIDLDLLFYGSSVIDVPGLQIPHPAAPNRAFVLIPLDEIAPDFIHPTDHISVTELLHRLIAETSRRDLSPGVDKIAPPGWEKIPLVSNGPS